MKNLAIDAKMQRLPNFNNKFFFLKFAIVVIIFVIDRASKIYLLNLRENGIDIDFYIFPFLNLYLIWNTGIGFGLFSFEADIYYQLVTTEGTVINFLNWFTLLICIFLWLNRNKLTNIDVFIASQYFIFSVLLINIPMPDIFGRYHYYVMIGGAILIGKLRFLKRAPPKLDPKVHP